MSETKQEKGTTGRPTEIVIQLQLANTAKTMDTTVGQQPSSGTTSAKDNDSRGSDCCVEAFKTVPQIDNHNHVRGMNIGISTPHEVTSSNLYLRYSIRADHTYALIDRTWKKTIGVDHTYIKPPYMLPPDQEEAQRSVLPVKRIRRAQPTKETKSCFLFECEICREFFTASEFTSHATEVHKMKPQFACPRCKRIFSNISDWNKHSNEKFFQCQLCQKRYVSKRQLKVQFRTPFTKHDPKVHQTVHTDNKQQEQNANSGPLVHQTLHTGDKQQEQNANSGLKVHQTLHTDVKQLEQNTNSGSKLYSTMHTDEMQQTQKDIIGVGEKHATQNKSHVQNIHKETHTQETSYECNKCLQRFPTKYDLISHQIAQTDEQHKPYYKQEFACSFCHRNFSKKNELVKHRLIHSGTQCELCGKRFITIARLKEHMLSHTDEKPYKCSICDRAFKSISARKHHMKIHEKRYKCEICHQKFEKKCALKDHQTEHTHEKNFLCEFCSQQFTTEVSLNRHLKIHADKKCHCNVCSKVFASSDYLSRHMHIHRETHKCDICEKCCISQDKLTSHKKKHSFQCRICKARFDGKLELMQHKRTHSNIKPYECEKCQKKILSAGGMKLHAKSHERDVKARFDGKPYECEKCQKRVLSAAGMKLHAKTHQRDVKCTRCQKYFTPSPQGTKQPCCKSCQKQLTDGKVYKCSRCGAVYNTFRQLINHSRKHILETLKCDKCNRVFSNKRHLQAHYGVDTSGNTAQEQCLSEFPGYYPCVLCRRVFKLKHNRAKHMKEHDGTLVKNYKCKVCSKAFLKKSALLSHAHCHDEEKPHACNVCDRKFGNSANLRRHEKVHGQMKKPPRTCQICQKRFNNDSTFKRHLRLKHATALTIMCYICQKPFEQHQYVDHMQQMHEEKEKNVKEPEYINIGEAHEGEAKDT